MSQPTYALLNSVKGKQWFCLVMVSEHHYRMNKPAVFAVLLGVVIVTLDISLTSTAIPAIATGIGAEPASTIWIINVYYLTVIAALLPLAALGEIYGHKKIFVIGLTIFAVGSLASGIAESLPALMIGRGFLGVGSAAVSATTPALIKALYPPTRLAHGLGLYAMVVGIAFTVGPIAASTVLAFFDWPWLFLFNVPVALLAIVMAVRGLPPTERHIRNFDVVSAALCAAMFAFLLYGIAGMAHLGWVTVVSAFVASTVCGYALRKREGGHAAPILAIDLLHIKLFTLSAITSVCAFTIQGLILVVLPFHFQFRLGYSQVEAGFLITPWPATLAVMTLIAPTLVRRFSPGLLGGIGLIIVALGLFFLTTSSQPASIYDTAWRLILCGIGFGLFQSPNMVALMSSAPSHRSGSAGGILATSRLLGQALGAASVAFCLSMWHNTGIEAAIWLGCAVALIGSAVSLLRITSFAKSQ